MCKKTKYLRKNIDPCLRKFIETLNKCGFKTKASCCGHGKYRESIIIEFKGKNYDFFTGKEITRKKRFYRKDSQRYYYLPEINGRIIRHQKKEYP